MMKTGMRLWTLLPRGCNFIGERVLNDRVVHVVGRSRREIHTYMYYHVCVCGTWYIPGVHECTVNVNVCIVYVCMNTV